MIAKGPSQENIGLSKIQGGLVFVAGVAYEADNAYAIYDNCWLHGADGNQRASLEACFRAIRYGIIRWCIELSALGKVTGWYERDEKIKHRDISIGGILCHELLPVNSGKRDMVQNLYSLSNGITYNYTDINGDPVDTEVNDIIAIGLGNSSDINMILQAAHNGTWYLTPMAPTDAESNATKRDGALSDYLYVKGHESVILECQYGAGIEPNYESVMSYSQWDKVNNPARKTIYHAFHGFIGNRDALKCAHKVYTNDQHADGWRSWDDIWRSF